MGALRAARTHTAGAGRVELVVRRALTDVAALLVDARAVPAVVRVLTLVDVCNETVKHSRRFHDTEYMTQ